jgi:hypothetical protein
MLWYVFTYACINQCALKGCKHVQFSVMFRWTVGYIEWSMLFLYDMEILCQKTKPSLQFYKKLERPVSEFCFSLSMNVN